MDCKYIVSLTGARFECKNWGSLHFPYKLVENHYLCLSGVNPHTTLPPATYLENPTAMINILQGHAAYFVQFTVILFFVQMFSLPLLYSVATEFPYLLQNKHFEGVNKRKYLIGLGVLLFHIAFGWIPACGIGIGPFSLEIGECISADFNLALFNMGYTMSILLATSWLPVLMAIYAAIKMSDSVLAYLFWVFGGAIIGGGYIYFLQLVFMVGNIIGWLFLIGSCCIIANISLGCWLAYIKDIDRIDREYEKEWGKVRREVGDSAQPLLLDY